MVFLTMLRQEKFYFDLVLLSLIYIGGLSLFMLFSQSALFHPVLRYFNIGLFGLLIYVSFYKFFISLPSKPLVSVFNFLFWLLTFFTFLMNLFMPVYSLVYVIILLSFVIFIGVLLFQSKKIKNHFLIVERSDFKFSWGKVIPSVIFSILTFALFAFKISLAYVDFPFIQETIIYVLFFVFNPFFVALQSVPVLSLIQFFLVPVYAYFLTSLYVKYFPLSKQKNILKLVIIFVVLVIFVLLSPDSPFIEFFF